MTKQQKEAFYNASLTEPELLNALFAGLFAAVIFLLSAWVLLSAFRGLSQKQLNWNQMGVITARVALFILVCLWLIFS